MSMKENIFQTLFSRKNKTIGVFELKLTKTGRLPFDRLATHQEQALLRAESTEGVAHKISDMSADKKPFDCFRIANTPAYVVILFYTPRKPKILYFIRIKDFLALRARSSMKSMTEGEAKLISEKTLEL